MEPKIETRDELKVIGFDVYTCLKNNQIPNLWARFIPYMGKIKNLRESGVAYGICINDMGVEEDSFTDSTEFRYIAGFEVTDLKSIPEGMVTHTIPAQRYAVFTHTGPLSELQSTYRRIYTEWAEKTDLILKRTEDFERYDERFKPEDPENSELEIWIPIK